MRSIDQPTTVEQPDALCHMCDQAISIGNLASGMKAACPRCDEIITVTHRNSLERILVFSLSAIVLLILSNQFAFITLSIRGMERSITLVQSVKELLAMGEINIAVILVMVIFVIPSLMTGSLLWLTLQVKRKTVTRKSLLLLRLIGGLKFWNMAEIYLLAVLISMVKVMSLAEITLGFSFWTFALLTVMLIAAMLHVDKHQLTQIIKQIIEQRDGIKQPPTDTETTPLVSCIICATIQSENNKTCWFCYHQLESREKPSLQRSWLFLITGMLLYIPANYYPIMVTRSLGTEETSTIIGGVLMLWQHGSYPIAIVIFIASIAVPIGKFLVLTALLTMQQFNLYRNQQSKIIAFRVIEFMGRWSMVDVFVVAFLAGLIQIGNLMSVYPGSAILAFAGMVITTMLAAESFDPRPFWNNDE
ncbi:paraquat-inducible protein A [Nitrosomonas aestuarii]|uniref:Paraquat-inducible protein A n=1 Tax=Nitrosomonas aestuarii TaxID=52441 RepID=A0A1I3ZWA4_9PROT|nr:paraquat-inducible protein A [Nitrosomonas aestuarii]SFK48444.1 paraquat-inducible protein A [Nitrosomonas aestuarii]